MTGTPQAPWDIYAQQLGYLGYGYPLWVPDPAPGSVAVEIGDVGWINRGEFQPLFNAFRGEDEAQPRGGVPVDHVPLDIRDCIISGPRDEISQPILCSTSIRRVDISGGLSGTLPLPNISSDISFNFVCTDEAGALLFLEPSGRTQEVLSRKLICDYIGVHFDRWMEFANDRLQIGLRENQIIFVSGTTKTRRWGVAAFKDTTREKRGAVVGNLGSLATMEISVSVSDAQLSPSHYRTGPAERLTSTFSGASLDDQYDQCVFIHYYKRKRRKLFPFPSVMRAAAGPHELPRHPDGGDGHQLCATDSSSDSDDFSDDDVVRLPKHQPAKHAADYILDYILENSSATVAIASDTDLPILEYPNQPQDFGGLVFPRDIPRYLATLKPCIPDLQNQRESGNLSSIPSDTYHDVADLVHNIPSDDSGYGSSLSSARLSLRQPNVWHLYKNWKAADDATKCLPAEVQALETCQSLLREAKKRCGIGRDKSVVQPKRGLWSMSLPRLLRKRSMQSAVPATAHPTDLATGTTPLSESSGTVEELETQVDKLQRSIANTRVIAEQLDECFNTLFFQLDGGRLIPPESMRSPSMYSITSQDWDLYRRARKTVLRREGVHLVTLSTTKALRYGCRTVQAAHHLYQEAKEKVDLLCRPNRSKLAVLFSGEESRKRTYLEAATRAQEAQACYDKCLELLRPHWHLLTRPELEAYENLHNTGLLQAATLYRLMYGGPNSAMGLSQEIQSMIQRQNDVFLQLTNFAAGVEKCTAKCEAVEQEARASRDVARRQLIAVYIQAEEF